jgi:2Fe-2S ferredoxin
MPTVVFESPQGEQTVAVPDGGALIDVCDAGSAPVPFSCRNANCGTCRVAIVEGQAELLPAEDEELDILDIFGLKPETHRLACQARCRPGLAVLRVRAVDIDV